MSVSANYTVCLVARATLFGFAITGCPITSRWSN
jgi:hypothetical protein